MDLSPNAFTVPAALGLLGIGVIVGAYGTMIGAGGGFLLVPVLLLVAPDLDPASVTAMSLAVVFFNAYSGTWAYARMGRIDYAAGILFAVAGIPGALFGTYVVTLIPREPFALVFGVLLLALGAFLVIYPHPSYASSVAESTEEKTSRQQRRSLLGAIASSYLGLLSTLLGIGGGILHVPFLIRVLHFPPHVATATSHFVLALVTLAGTGAHLVQGELQQVLAPTASLALGVTMGAPIGATLSSFIRGRLLIRLLALALSAVAARLLWLLFKAWS
jgi:hypothetical protein